MITGPVNTGSGSVGIIVRGGIPGIWNSIASGPLAAFASRIAWRKDPAPLSFVVVTVKVAPRTAFEQKTTPASTTMPRGSLKPHTRCCLIRNGARPYHRRILVQGIGMGYYELGWARAPAPPHSPKKPYPLGGE